MSGAELVSKKKKFGESCSGWGHVGFGFGCSGTVDGLIVGVCAAAWGSSRLRILGWFLPKSNLERDFESWEIRRRMRMSDISRLVRRFEGSFFFSFFSLEVCWFAGWLVVWFFSPVADWSWDDLGVLIICTVGKAKVEFLLLLRCVPCTMACW